LVQNIGIGKEVGDNLNRQVSFHDAAQCHSSRP